ncbi:MULTISPECIES: hypothetical protein [Pseudomonas]|uniref:hypothetical protein n=1 Tax=Pseudomonas TaxID=286 RepID=UPI001602EB90|nr:hypothetical protein [Pseudomonas putida]
MLIGEHAQLGQVDELAIGLQHQAGMFRIAGECALQHVIDRLANARRKAQQTVEGLACLAPLCKGTASRRGIG